MFPGCPDAANIAACSALLGGESTSGIYVHSIFRTTPEEKKQIEDELKKIQDEAEQEEKKRKIKEINKKYINKISNSFETVALTEGMESKELKKVKLVKLLMITYLKNYSKYTKEDFWQSSGDNRIISIYKGKEGVKMIKGLYKNLYKQLNVYFKHQQCGDEAKSLITDSYNILKHIVNTIRLRLPRKHGAKISSIRGGKKPNNQ